MYIPPAFAETDLPKLHDFVEQNSFGLLVSEVAGGPFASHLPFLLDRSQGLRGKLIGHMARANPQWQHFGSQTILTVFSGSHAYISPTWYEAENTVPTWNYMAVHVYGQATLIEDEPGLLEIVERTVSHYERNFPRPWALDRNGKFARGLLSQIVGFSLEIERIEGKFKLNQNQPLERQAKVAAVLCTQKGDNPQGIAAAMQMRLRETRE